MMSYELERKERERRDILWGIDWPGHPNRKARTEIEKSLQDEPERWEFIFLSTDPLADYSYDDLALMKRNDGIYSIIRTTGCSCPSPTETWGEEESGTIDGLLRHCKNQLMDRETCFDEMCSFLEKYVP